MRCRYLQQAEIRLVTHHTDEMNLPGIDRRLVTEHLAPCSALGRWSAITAPVTTDDDDLRVRPQRAKPGQCAHQGVEAACRFEVAGDISYHGVVCGQHPATGKGKARSRIR